MKMIDALTQFFETLLFHTHLTPRPASSILLGGLVRQAARRVQI